MGAEVREEQMSLPGPLSATVMTPIAVQSIVTVLRRFFVSQRLGHTSLKFQQLASCNRFSTPQSISRPLLPILLYTGWACRQGAGGVGYVRTPPNK